MTNDPSKTYDMTDQEIRLAYQLAYEQAINKDLPAWEAQLAGLRAIEKRAIETICPFCGNNKEHDPMCGLYPHRFPK